jgi:hypothetical protein
VGVKAFYPREGERISATGTQLACSHTQNIRALSAVANPALQTKRRTVQKTIGFAIEREKCESVPWRVCLVRFLESNHGNWGVFLKGKRVAGLE